MGKDRATIVSEYLKSRRRLHWCTASICACIGCVNKGGNNKIKLTREEFDEFMRENESKQ